MLANRQLERRVQWLEINPRGYMVALGHFGHTLRRCADSFWR